MVRKILVITVLFLLVFQSSVFAEMLEGEVIFRDALYGAAIGALLGTAIYLVDQDNLATKIGTGVAIGTFGGLVFGIIETRSFVHIKKDRIKFAMPTPVIQKRNNGTQYSASLLKADF